MNSHTFFSVEGGLARIVLNRPQVLNALAPGQFAEIDGALAGWGDDPSVRLVLVEGAGERAFCAGGDIRAVWDGRARGDHGGNRRIFRDEYRLDARVHYFTKPYVSLMDGIVMGGGAGLAVNGRFRIATERSLFAMPETAIGFFPDVGATHFLNRCPEGVGLYLGLTGARLKAADMLYCGLATHVVPSAQLPALKAALAQDPMAVEAILAAFHGDPGPAPLAERQAAMARCFAGDSIAAIRQSLADEPGEWARAAETAMDAASPTSLAVTLRQLRGGRGLDFAQCMRREYRMACQFLANEDFYEGVRAVVVDKDRRPCWQAAPSDQHVDQYFASLADELTFGDQDGA